ncbi:hypothetical protein [Sphingobium yanoikuyae]|uniref:hypothetical protein n=1 Tax=Sphingobium yanoikuyae TaxID=13690 RepID=UPI0028A04418|nr:hypothetical protein [Sphingobium yanoikuyae]
MAFKAQGLAIMLRPHVSDGKFPASFQGAAMLPVRLTGQIPTPPVGADLTAVGHGDDGHLYYCKDDDGHRPVRATEQLFTALADHVNIPTAATQVIEFNGQSLFGSFCHPSTDETEAVRKFISEKAHDELGGPSRWKGSYFSRLFAFDAFVGNIDRNGNNLVAYRDGAAIRILAIDFAASTLLMRPGLDTALDETSTVKFNRLMRRIHGLDEDASLEMVARLESVPLSFIESVLDRMPPTWLDAGMAQRFLEFWRDGSRSKRLAKIGAGLKDGTL